MSTWACAPVKAWNDPPTVTNRGGTMRLTAAVRQKLLDQNEGFELSTSNVQKNGTHHRTYRISGGRLHIHATGKGAWADSRYDEQRIATDEQTHRFLREYQGRLNTDGL